MVYSPELGYDPDEWEECPESDHFLVMSMFTRVCLSIGTVMASVLFFWVLETNKRRHRKCEEETKPEQHRAVDQPSQWQVVEEETVETKFARAAQEAALKAQPERRRNSKRELNREEEAALLAWQAEVQRLAVTRLRASQEPPSDSEEETRVGNEQQQNNSELGSSRTAEEVERVQMEWEKRQKQLQQQHTHEEHSVTKDVAQLSERRFLQEVEPPQLQFQRPAEQQTERLEQQVERSAEQQQQQLLHEKQQHEQTVHKIPEAKTAELRVPISEWAKTKQLIRVVQQDDRLPHQHPGATPPSTPPGGIALPELAAHYRQMADELTRKLTKELDEMELEEEVDSAQMAEQFQQRHRQDIAGGLESTAAPKEMRQRLARQLESHVAEVVAREMRKRSSFSALARETDDGTVVEVEQFAAAAAVADDEQREQMPRLLLKTGSSGESSEDDFVKVERQPTIQTDECCPPGTALRTVMRVTAAVDSGGQHGLTPSPQMGGPVTEEEHEEQVRVSMFEGDGGSTTADEIEYVPSLLGQSKQNAESTSVQRSKQRPLGAEEAEQVLALLQEYDLSAGEVVPAEPPLGADDAFEQQRRWGRQVSSGAATSSGGVISLPDSTQRTTPAGGSSVPESPDSAVFGFVNILPSSGAEVSVQVQKAQGEASRMAQEDEPQIEVQHFESMEKLEQYQQQAQQLQDLQQTLQCMETAEIAGGPVDVGPQVEQQQHRQQTDTTAELKQQQQQPALKRRKDGSLKSAGSGGHSSAFVVEEEMLESVAEESAGKGQRPMGTKQDEREEGTAEAQPMLESGDIKEQKHLLKSPEAVERGGGSSATSRQIGTNEAFDRPADAALLFEDLDDKDVTYAPEIQSLEVPPDQLSQADSLNLLDEEQFSEEQPHVSAERVLPSVDEQQRHHGEEDDAVEPLDQAEVPVRELTPHEEEQLQRDIDRLRRTQSPRLHKVTQMQVPHAPQFLRSYFNDESTSSLSSTSIRQSSLLSALGVTSTQEMLLRLTSLEALSDAMRKAGLESSNLIFGIDYTASNKYQGERSFGGQSLHSIDPQMDNPYQTVIKIMGRTLAPFAGHEYGIPVFGFGDSTTGDWTVFSLNEDRDCESLDGVLSVYNRVTPQIDLSGPTNFAPLIYRAMEICQRRRDYHILVIIADGQVTNEKATVKAIVSACQYPLSIIVVGVGDGPWEMMRIFDESLPKRPWDNFHFVELHELINQRADQPMESRELAFAVHSLLEIPDQYATIRKMGLLSLTAYFTRPPSHSPRRSKSPKTAQSFPPAAAAVAAGDERAREKESKC